MIPVYRDVLLALEAARQGSPLWPAFHNIAYRPHRPFFDGLTETYGSDLFGPLGLPGVVAASAPALHQALYPTPTYQLEERTTALLDGLKPHLPGKLPTLYLGTLLFIAPAATLSVEGRPAIAIGVERFTLQPPTEGQKFWYHPDELVEIIPHEAAHAVRMEALGLPPTPQRLSLLDMVLLEGTALLFTDLLIGGGKESLATFMERERLDWHQANEGHCLATIWPDLAQGGMEPFRRYFMADSPVSGYWVGLALCRRYIERYGPAAITELLLLPSAEVLRRIA